MLKMDKHDVELLRIMYGYAPTFDEIFGWKKDRARWQKNDIRAKLYRLSKNRLCACDKPGMHPGQPRCWSLSPRGEFVVESVDHNSNWIAGEDVHFELVGKNEYNVSKNSTLFEVRSYHHRSGKSEHGRSSVFITCSFCSTEVEAFLWSLAGCGKKCSCGEMSTTTK
jgi:hypothetical protein